MVMDLEALATFLAKRDSRLVSARMTTDGLVTSFVCEPVDHGKAWAGPEEDTAPGRPPDALERFLGLKGKHSGARGADDE